MPDTPTTIELRRELKACYTASPTRPSLLVIPELSVLAIEGVGSPESADFQAAVQAMYTCAYTLKFFVKQNAGVSYPVMPLESLWGGASGADFDLSRRESWAWKVLIVVPDLVTAEMLASQRSKCVAKAPAAAGVSVQRFAEGRVCQLMHLGSFETEPASIVRLHAFIAESGLERRGLHHEIYLSDPRRTAPETWRTILRQPVS